MSKNQKAIQSECDHIAGYIGRHNESLVTLISVSKLDGVNQKSIELAERGFIVTVFPHCPVCGVKLLAGSYQPKDPVNGKVVQ